MSTANPTVRKFPRSMREAFPGDPAYGCAISHSGPGVASIGRWFGYCIGTAVMLLFAASVWSWTQTPPIESVELADARTQQQTQARFEKAARAMCKGRVAWIDPQRNMVQCAKQKAAP